MKKTWGAYFAAITIIAVIAAAGIWAAAAEVIPRSAGLLVFSAGAAAAAWWTAYYRALEYRRDGDILTVKSGVFFWRSRRVSVGDILWTSRAAVRFFGNAALFTTLRTAGGSILIFGEFSTER